MIWYSTILWAIGHCFSIYLKLNCKREILWIVNNPRLLTTALNNSIFWKIILVNLAKHPNIDFFKCARPFNMWRGLSGHKNTKQNFVAKRIFFAPPLNVKHGNNTMKGIRIESLLSPGFVTTKIIQGALMNTYRFQKCCYVLSLLSVLHCYKNGCYEKHSRLQLSGRLNLIPKLLCSVDSRGSQLESEG